MHQTADYQFFIAGVNVVTNRNAPLGTRGFSDCRLHILFCDPTKYERRSGLSKHWVTVPGERGGRSKLSIDGKFGLVLDSDLSSAQCAVEIRRIVPFAAAIQEQIVLHASAVIMDDSILAFIGESGAGKSTLASALGDAGFELVADDLLPCRAQEGEIVVPLLSANQQLKRRIGRMFFLLRSSALLHSEATRLRPIECLRLLLFNSFGEMQDKQVWKMQFEAYGKMAASIDAFNLTIPDDLSRIEDTIYWLTENVRNFQGSTVN